GRRFDACHFAVRKPLRWVFFDMGIPACGPVSPFFCGKAGGSWSFSPAHVRGKTIFTGGNGRQTISGPHSLFLHDDRMPDTGLYQAFRI
ncbi:MAG: hypothetical protein ACI3XT_03630, partial [Butyricicoccaceae bacterium]